MKYIRVALIVLMLFVLANCATAKQLSGKVVSIQDGDTITLLARNKEHKIRLDGIDCPEKDQAWGNRARQLTSDLVFGALVTVTYEGKDVYNRILGTVYLADGRILNQELLKAGLAWHYKYYNKSVVLADMETAARKAGKGLWSDPHPVPPWDFRRQKK